ncbi:MAG: hypothetical protein JWN32_3480, partial [Solirubrobacterales bacterium]|nr:hypothetical protein [Solirubrobacterales bacterium]
MRTPRRTLATVLAVAGVLALAPAATAKDGVALSPALSSLKPGAGTDVRLFVFGVRRHDREVVPAPRAGVRAVVVLRPLDGGRALRFRSTPLDRTSG